MKCTSDISQHTDWICLLLLSGKLHEHSAANGTAHANFKRVIGTPAKKLVSLSAKKWTVKPMSSSPSAADVGVEVDRENQSSTDMHSGCRGNRGLHAQEQEQQWDTNNFSDSKLKSDKF